MANIQIAQVSDYKKQRRVTRRPKETFNIKYKPYEIVPFMLHPVLPGETLDSAFYQARVVTDKCKSNLIGWWHETHFFYVPLRALTDEYSNGGSARLTEEQYAQFFLAFTTVSSGSPAGWTGLVHGSNNVPYYGAKWLVDFMGALFTFVVQRWFRDEDELGTALGALDTYPAAQIDELRDSWTNSLKRESTGTDDSELPGVDELEELDILPGFTNGGSP